MAELSTKEKAVRVLEKKALLLKRRAQSARLALLFGSGKSLWAAIALAICALLTMGTLTGVVWLTIQDAPRESVMGMAFWWGLGIFFMVHLSRLAWGLASMAWLVGLGVREGDMSPEALQVMSENSEKEALAMKERDAIEMELGQEPAPKSEPKRL